MFFSGLPGAARVSMASSLCTTSKSLSETIGSWFFSILTQSLSSLKYFRVGLFDLLNDSEGMGIADLNAHERNSLLTVRITVKCQQGQLIITKNELSAEHEK